jgi:hypothetical protein
MIERRASMSKSKDLQGEGNYDAAKEFDQAEEKFVKSGKVEQAARDAEPKDIQEQKEIERAEEEGKKRAKDEDPQLKRRPANKTRGS